MPKTKRNVPALTPAEALGMLASAITYMQQAGLRVRAGNDSQLGLVLAIDGARVTVNEFGVTGFEPMPVASNPPGEPASNTSNPPDVASTPAVEPASTSTGAVASNPPDVASTPAEPASTPGAVASHASIG